MHERTLDDSVRPYFLIDELHDIFHTMRIDDTLVTVLVERWRQGTHTFHLSVAEAIVTFQGSAVLPGLQIEGRPVTGHPMHNRHATCYELLDVMPNARSLDGARLRL